MTVSLSHVQDGMYTGQYIIHDGITNMNLDESMYVGRACMNIARASMKTVRDSIHIGIVYIYWY